MAEGVRVSRDTRIKKGIVPPADGGSLAAQAAQEPRGLPRLYRGQWEGNKATYCDGVLRTERPKSDEARAKRISVKTA